jgi:DNA mismatch repair protein MLH1
MDRAANSSTSSSSESAGAPKISVLPQEVVDRIAAGEVVQRPASVVKELLENCLDAGSTNIVVHVEKGGLSKISISDNGCGISQQDLELAATRHATSKLKSVDDFPTLQTFGFRGEALASISMVSKLSILTRTKTSQCAYSQNYQDGKPVTIKPKMCARQPGTTITVQDLFYNVPHRKKTFSKKESDEYNNILQTVQYYAIHYPHVGFCCTRMHKRNKLVDINTSQLSAVRSLISKIKLQPQSPESSADSNTMEEKSLIQDRIRATKQVMSHVFESKMESHIHQLEISEKGQESHEEDDNKFVFEFESHMYFTSPSYAGKQTKFVLFVNDRLVNLPTLKRNLEDAYTDFTKHKPVLVVSIKVPGNQVDVNVHPAKSQVALIFQDELCYALRTKLLEALQAQNQEFQAESVAPGNNPAKKRKQSELSASFVSSRDSSTATASTSSTIASESSDSSQQPAQSHASQAAATTTILPKPAIKKKTPPSQLIRTSGATPVGAIEPFLVSTQNDPPPPTQLTQSSASTASPSSSGVASLQQSQSSGSSTIAVSQSQALHKSDCPLSNTSLTQDVDMSQPGAFATVSSLCSCFVNSATDNRPAIRIQRTVVRPKRVTPSKVEYDSIKSLRKKVNKYKSEDLAKKLREAYFVGVVSHQRSLVQFGEELVMINHVELAKNLFYQLALARFGEPTIAKLGDNGDDSGIDIQALIADTLQVEDQLAQDDPEQSPSVLNNGSMLNVSENNLQLAEQATTCLEDNAEMMKEYYGISIISKNNKALLVGLPVLLDGHAPEPHGLGIFLLRLATQVDWSEEKPCFQGICRELGNYYSSLPTSDHQPYVQHTLFPAISYLLVPPEHLSEDGNVKVLTRLSTLYKVFERC